MTVNLTTEQQARLAELAARKGCSTDEIVQEALTQYLDEEARFADAVTLGLAAADRGDFVSPDEVPDPTRLHLVTRLNGKEVQHTGIDDLIFDIPTLISYCSDWTPLVAGDVISTGTPEGVGFARKPPLWMRPGDVVEVEIDGGIGVLRNPIVAES